MPQSYYLKFESEEEAKVYLKQIGLVSEEGEILVAGISHAIDIVGKIFKGGEYNENGEEISPPVELEGWHLNYLGDSLPSELEPFSVTPKKPSRVWFMG